MSPDAAYWRNYRQQNRERVNALTRARRAISRIRGDRSKEYAARKSRAVSQEPLPELFPHLVKGSKFIFWEEELQRDLVQVRALAELEGADVEAAVRAYVNWEHAWRRQIVSFIGNVHAFVDQGLTPGETKFSVQLEQWVELVGQDEAERISRSREMAWKRQALDALDPFDPRNGGW